MYLYVFLHCVIYIVLYLYRFGSCEGMNCSAHTTYGFHGLFLQPVQARWSLILHDNPAKPWSLNQYLSLRATMLRASCWVWIRPDMAKRNSGHVLGGRASRGKRPLPHDAPAGDSTGFDESKPRFGRATEVLPPCDQCRMRKKDYRFMALRHISSLKRLENRVSVLGEKRRIGFKTGPLLGCIMPYHVSFPIDTPTWSGFKAAFGGLLMPFQPALDSAPIDIVLRSTSNRTCGLATREMM